MEDIILQSKSRESKEKDKIKHLESSLKEKEISCETLRLDLAEVNLVKDSLLAERDCLRGDIRVLEEKLLLMGSEFHDFKLQANLINQEKEYLSKENEFFSKQLDEQLREMNELRGSLKNLGEIQSQENLVLKKELSEAKNSLLIASGDNSVIGNEISYLQNELFESLETLKMMEEELNLANSRAKFAQEELEAVKNENFQLKSSANNSIEAKEKLEQEKIVLETEIAVLSADHREVLGRSEEKAVESTQKLVNSLKMLSNYITELELD